MEPTALLNHITALTNELAAYRELPLVPRQDYERAVQRAAQAEAELDAMARELANARDSRANVQATETMRHLVAVLRTLSAGAGSPDEASVWNAARAHVAGATGLSEAAMRMLEATREWEGRHGR